MKYNNFNKTFLLFEDSAEVSHVMGFRRQDFLKT
jgi:hypothetical protein